MVSTSKHLGILFVPSIASLLITTSSPHKIPYPMDDSDTGVLNKLQIVVLLSGIVLSLCSLLFLIIWKVCLPCRGRLDLRKRRGGCCKLPKQGGDEESGLASAHDDVALYMLPFDRHDRNTPAIAHPNKVHIRSHQTGMTRQSVPNPDTRTPLGQLPRHQEANRSTTRHDQVAMRAWQTKTALRLAEARNVPHNAQSPTHTVLRYSHTNINAHSRGIITNSKMQTQPVGNGKCSPQPSHVEAQPPRLQTPRFSRQAFVFDPDMTVLQGAGENNDLSKIHAAEVESVSGFEEPEKGVKESSTRAPSFVSENPPPSYRTEPPLD